MYIIHPSSLTGQCADERECVQMVTPRYCSWACEFRQPPGEEIWPNYPSEKALGLWLSNSESRKVLTFYRNVKDVTPWRRFPAVLSTTVRPKQQKKERIAVQHTMEHCAPVGNRGADLHSLICKDLRVRTCAQGVSVCFKHVCRCLFVPGMCLERYTRSRQQRLLPRAEGVKGKLIFTVRSARCTFQILHVRTAYSKIN